MAHFATAAVSCHPQAPEFTLVRLANNSLKCDKYPPLGEVSVLETQADVSLILCMAITLPQMTSSSIGPLE